MDEKNQEINIQNKNIQEQKIQKSRNLILYVLFLILTISIGIGVYGFKSIYSQKTGNCQHKNSKFDFRFEYNCKRLSGPGFVDYSGCMRNKTCKSFIYDGNYQSGLDYSVIEPKDFPLCADRGDLYPTYPMGTFICYDFLEDKNEINFKEIVFSDFSGYLPTTSKNEIINEFKKEASFYEKSPEVILTNSNNVTFYKVLANGGTGNDFRICSVIPFYENYLICFEDDLNLSDDMKYILDNFSFY